MTRGSADLYRCKDTLKIPSTHAAYPCSIFNVKLCYVQCDWYLNLQWRAEICGYPGDNFMFWMDVKDHLLRFRCPHSWFPKLMFCPDAHLCYRHQVDNPVCATTPPPPHLFFHLFFCSPLWLSNSETAEVTTIFLFTGEFVTFALRLDIPWPIL